MSTHTPSITAGRRRLSWAALACGVMLATSVHAQTTGAPASDGRAGVFLFAHGPVSVRAGGMASAVVRGTVVHEGDVVETGPGGRAQLRMVDGAMIDLEPGSTLRLAEYQLADQPKDHRSLLELVRGGLRTLTGVIGQQNQSGYELRVRTVTIGVRGTEYRTELQGDEQVLLDVLQGRVALCNPSGCVDVARGESARAPLSGALPVRTAAAMVPGGAAASATSPAAVNGAVLPAVPGGASPAAGAAPIPRVSVDGQAVPVTLLPPVSAAPALPAAPGQPTTPATPAAPATPAVPGAPSQPATPATPASPGGAGQPVTPVQPGGPGVPATPATPGAPGQPATPATPAQPGGPGTPATPAVPATPAIPGGPGQPATPAVPANPGGPGQPATPATPAQPNNPGQPATPATPARPAR